MREQNPIFRSIISSKQHGFSSGKSKTTNLVVMETDIVEAFSGRKQLDAIYNDFSKAFDRVSHCHLMTELEAYSIIGDLHWFESYLTTVD